jgi:two-component system, LuxR family, response regulator FixJ
MIRNVYIVDDDDLVCAATTRLLALDWALAVRSFASGDRFLAEAPRLDPGVVLLDFRMPGASGVDVLNALREIPVKKFAVIVATGEGDTQLAVQVMKLGAIDFIEKPYDVDTLLGVVNAGFVHLVEGQEASEHTDIARAKIETLTPRERDVLAGLIDGKANKVIAYNLDISPRTVEVYRSNLMDKLSVSSLPAALRIAFTAGMIPLAF